LINQASSVKSSKGDYILLNNEDSRESIKKQDSVFDLTPIKTKLLELENRLKAKFG
jgi:hypothetical protein